MVDEYEEYHRRHAEKCQELIRLHKKYPHARVFIETGTLEGDTTAALQGYFDKLYTIELSDEWFQHAQMRFQDERKVDCLYGDSATVLEDLLPRVQEPAFFWLDAHYSLSNTARGTLDCPVLVELGVILTRPYDDVIVIDDARLFLGGTEHFSDPASTNWPSLDSVKERAAGGGYEYKECNDMIQLTRTEQAT